MTHYLREKGHRDIAFVGSVYANENIMDRYYGYRKGLEEAGIPFRKEWVLEDRDLIAGNMRVELPDNMPTAFVCNSDLSAGYLHDVLIKKDSESRKIFRLSAMTTICLGIVLQTILPRIT